jgi:hypothetical protein
MSKVLCALGVAAGATGIAYLLLYNQNNQVSTDADPNPPLQTLSTAACTVASDALSSLSSFFSYSTSSLALTLNASVLQSYASNALDSITDFFSSNSQEDVEFNPKSTTRIASLKPPTTPSTRILNQASNSDSSPTPSSLLGPYNPNSIDWLSDSRSLLTPKPTLKLTSVEEIPYFASITSGSITPRKASTIYDHPFYLGMIQVYTSSCISELVDAGKAISSFSVGECATKHVNKVLKV